MSGNTVVTRATLLTGEGGVIRRRQKDDRLIRLGQGVAEQGIRGLVTNTAPAAVRRLLLCGYGRVFACKARTLQVPLAKVMAIIRCAVKSDRWYTAHPIPCVRLGAPCAVPGLLPLQFRHAATSKDETSTLQQ